MVDLLLLQGPVGSFFKDVQCAAEAHGLKTLRLTFDRNDDFFSGRYERFKGDYEEVLARLSPKKILLFGCGRAHHLEFLRLAKARNIPVFCLEEGYIREGFITLEQGGNNALSPLKSLTSPLPSLKNGARPRFAFYFMMIYAIIRYCLIAWPQENALIHRPRKLRPQIYFWAKNLLLKFAHNAPLPPAYFLVAMQVYDDAALTAFGRGFTNERLVELLKHRNDVVFKIHPFERGHKKYTVPLVYDAPLGRLMKHAKGLITINSTAALVAFSLNKPVFALGDAFYNVEGLASQQTLEGFLENPTPPTNWQAMKAAIFQDALVTGDFYAKNVRCQTVEGVLNRLYG